MDSEDSSGFSLWGEVSEGVFAPTFKPFGETLTPGVYKIWFTPSGALRFGLQDSREEPLMRFPGTVDSIIKEIRTFWERRPIYEALNIPHRRGILLFGPPGTGKTSLVRLALNEVVARKGIGIIFSDLGSCRAGYDIIRQIQPDVPIVIAIEDLDNFVSGRGRYESQLLDLLDGHDKGVTNTVFVATTNFIKRIPDRIKNRPSRFDKKFEIGFPPAQQRRVFFESLIRSVPKGLDTFEHRFDAERVVEDTKGLSLAHVKELFVAVTVFGSDYAATLESLRSTDFSDEE